MLRIQIIISIISIRIYPKSQLFSPQTITIDKNDKSNLTTAGSDAKPSKNPSDDDWTKEQQTALEKALRVFTKEYEGDRWMEISKCVVGKSKKECMLRYKAIAEKLRAMKQ